MFDTNELSWQERAADESRGPSPLTWLLGRSRHSPLLACATILLALVAAGVCVWVSRQGDGGRVPALWELDERLRVVPSDLREPAHEPLR